jgi:superfamily II DNA or RNA helicase
VIFGILCLSPILTNRRETGMSLFELAGFRDRSHTYGPPPGYEYREWQISAGSVFAEKHERADGKPFNFLLNGGVGSGKTDAAAGIGTYILNRKVAERIVYVCPNKMIIDSVIDTFKRFNIHLVNWDNGKFPYGEPVSMDGLAMTYASLNNNIHVQKSLCRKPTALFLDEIHHLGDSFAWCGAAKEAYEGRVRVAFGFTGTPWREDNRVIPFVEYEPEHNGILLYRADYTYSLGKAIHDKVCRSPAFIFLDADVEIPTRGAVHTYSFQEELNEKLANRRLAGAVRHGTPTRRMAMERLINECRCGDGYDKSIIFVGGDSSNGSDSGKKDAQVYVVEELIALGIPANKIVSVTCDDSRAAAKIRDFGKSDAWFLVAIDMVSEGVNIPEAKAALFLSTVTAKLKTIQRIGRVLRGQGRAIIIMFSDLRYIQVHKEIEKDKEFYEAVNLPAASVTERKSGERKQRQATEAKGIKAWLDFFGQHGEKCSPEEFDAVREYLEANGIPSDTNRVLNFLELAEKGWSISRRSSHERQTRRHRRSNRGRTRTPGRQSPGIRDALQGDPLRRARLRHRALGPPQDDPAGELDAAVRPQHGQAVPLRRRPSVRPVHRG